MKTDDMPRQYWKANPHQWGPGQTHIIHEDGTKTLCGQRLSECPGKHIPANEYDCRACARALESREHREKTEQEWRERQRQYEEERAEQNRTWWIRYNAYLQSPEWAQKRAAVLRRAKGRCEACNRHRATQVHHLTYEHLGNEPLWELRAICSECHKELTEADRRRRGTS